MQLDKARLCLNCEEIHDAPTCPRCASERYVYMTRWVPAEKPNLAPSRPLVRPTRVQRILFGGGVIGLVAFGVARWMRRARTQLETHSLRHAGELR